MKIKLYTKTFVEMKHGDCACAVGVASFLPTEMAKLTDEDAAQILRRVAGEALKSIPNSVRVLSCEYISAQEASDIIRYQEYRKSQYGSDEEE